MSPVKPAVPRFEWRQSPNNGQFYWRLKSPNGKIVCQSEGYTKKHNCLKGIEAVKKLAPLAEVREIV